MLSTKKIALGATTLATAAALAVAVTKTPQTPFEEMNNAEKTEFLAKQAEKKQARTYTWNDRASVVTNVAEGAKTTGNIIAQGAEKSTDYPAPLTAALALELLGLGAAAKSDKKKAKLKQQREEQRIAYEQQQAKQAEEARKKEEAQQAREAQKAEEAKKAEIEAKTSHLDDINKSLPFHSEFYYSLELDNFGVKNDYRNGRKIDKKAGNLESAAKYGGTYEEYYTSKDGKTVVAGIVYGNVPKGVNPEDYTYRYVRLEDPTIPGKVCEVGKAHYISPKGYAVEFDAQKTYKGEEEYYMGGERHTRKKFEYDDLGRYAIRTDSVVRYFPEYEHQQRKEIAERFIYANTPTHHWYTGSGEELSGVPEIAPTSRVKLEDRFVTKK